MNTPSNAASESAVQSQAAALAVVTPGRLFYWCMRRELPP